MNEATDWMPQYIMDAVRVKTEIQGQKKEETQKNKEHYHESSAG